MAVVDRESDALSPDEAAMMRRKGVKFAKIGIALWLVCLATFAIPIFGTTPPLAIVALGVGGAGSILSCMACYNLAASIDRNPFNYMWLGLLAPPLGLLISYFEKPRKRKK